MYSKSRYSKASARIKKRSKIKNTFNIFVKVGLPIVFLIVGTFLLRADFAQLKKVEVVGNQDVKTEEVEKIFASQSSGKYLFLIPKSNILLFKKSQLIKNILADLPRVDSALVYKSFDGTLKVDIKERRGDFIWCSSTDVCYLMSQNGLIFGEASAGEKLGKIVFRGGVVGDPVLQKFAEESVLANYLKAVDILKNSKFQVYAVSVESKNKAVLQTDVGEIFLNPEEDMSLAAQNAIILINDVKAKNPKANFEYIDVRFGNKVFYKLDQ